MDESLGYLDKHPDIRWEYYVCKSEAEYKEIIQMLQTENSRLRAQPTAAVPKPEVLPYIVQ